MGAGKKARAKERKTGKLAMAAQAELTAKAVALLPSGMENLGVFDTLSEVPLENDTSNGPTNTVHQPMSSSDQEAPNLHHRQGCDQHGPAVQIVYHTRSTLPPSWKEPLFSLFKSNMKEQYESNWGYREAEKRSEIFSQESRYLIAVQTSPGDGEAQGEGTPVGFVHIRYVLDRDEEIPTAVLYVYEIQLAPSVQRRGLGARMLSVVESMAVKLKMRKIKLTVFKSNGAALAFYLNKLGYDVDGTSPSQHKILGECYEILSKDVAEEDKKLAAS